jgi:hypothetical protein
MISDADRTACRSADGGETWTLHPITAATDGMLFQVVVFDGAKFITWGVDWATNNGVRYRSDDGMTWEETPTNGPIWISAAGVTPDGSIVTATGQYEEQSFSRSSDGGLTWAAVPPASFVQSHAITRFASGYVDSNTLCP